jgi:hypothetical protein
MFGCIHMSSQRSEHSHPCSCSLQLEKGPAWGRLYDDTDWGKHGAAVITCIPLQRAVYRCDEILAQLRQRILYVLASLFHSCLSFVPWVVRRSKFYLVMPHGVAGEVSILFGIV